MFYHIVVSLFVNTVTSEKSKKILELYDLLSLVSAAHELANVPEWGWHKISTVTYKSMPA